MKVHVKTTSMDVAILPGQRWTEESEQGGLFEPHTLRLLWRWYEGEPGEMGEDTSRWTVGWALLSGKRVLKSGRAGSRNATSFFRGPDTAEWPRWIERLVTRLAPSDQVVQLLGDLPNPGTEVAR